MMSNRFNKRKILLIVVSIFIIVAFCVGLLFFMLKDDSSSRKKDDPNITVSSPEEAAAQLKELGDDFGYENALSELTEKSTTTIDGDTYYRLQQNYQGIPVYGRTVVYVTDETGEVMAITGNVIDVREDIDLSPTVTAAEVESSVRAYLSEELGHTDTDSMSISIQNDSNLYLYNMSDTKDVRLAYVLYVNVYEIVVDAHNGDILCFSETVSDADTAIGYAASDDLHENSFHITLNDVGIYELTDTTHSFSVYTLQNLNSDDLLDSAFNNVPFEWEKVQLIESQDVIFGNSASEILLEAENGAKLLLNVIDMQDYFCELGFTPAGKTLLFYNDAYKEGKNARASYVRRPFPQLGENSSSHGVLFIGSVTGVNDIDIIAHEYTHRVSRQIIAWSGQSTQKDALNEALSDIFGVIIEAKLRGNGLDWTMEGDNSAIYRNIANPRETGYRAVITDDNNSHSTDTYAYSTVISHAAYLMSVDSGGSLSIDELAKLWYRAMLMMPSDCDFAQCRTLVELAGESMDLPDNKIQCISSAFDNVGILGSNTVDYTIDKNVEMNVYGVDSQLHDNYTICITGRQLCIENIDKLDKNSIGIPLDFKYLSMILTKEYSNAIEINTAQPANLHLPFGVYKITLYDNTDNSKTYSFRVSVEGSGNKDKLDIYTNFSGNDKDETDIEQIPEVDPATIDGAVYFNGHCYKVYNGQASWEDAAAFCQSVGGHLATITSEEENTFLHDYLVSMGLSGAYFGFSDVNIEGKWVWCTGEEVTFANWDSGEPNNEGRKEHYGLFDFSHNDGKWNDGSYRSGTNTNFICEWDAVAPPNTGNNGSTTTVYLLKQSVTYSVDYDNQPSKTKNFQYSQDGLLTGVSIEIVSKRTLYGETSYEEQLLEYYLECNESGFYSGFSASLDGSYSGKGTITCDANGRIVEFYSSETGQKYTFSYNTDGLMSEYIYEYKGEVYTHSKMQYDSRGNIVSAERIQRDGRKTESRTEIEYDVGDGLVMMTQYIDGVEQNSILQRCDTYGNVMKEEHYKDGTLVGWIEYTYESQTVPGSWQKLPDLILTLLGG